MTYPPEQPFQAQPGQPYGQPPHRMPPVEYFPPLQDPAEHTPVDDRPQQQQLGGRPPIDYFPPLEPPSDQPPADQSPVGQSPARPRAGRPKPGYGSRRAPPNRRGAVRIMLIGTVVGALVAVGVIVAATSGSHGSPSHAGTRSRTPVATATATTPAPGPTSVIATFTGHGSANTDKFTVSASWVLQWSYTCSALGASGNFIVAEDGGRDISGAKVNELGKHGQGQTTVSKDQGQHFLSVVSQCAWKLQVVGTPLSTVPVLAVGCPLLGEMTEGASDLGISGNHDGQHVTSAARGGDLPATGQAHARGCKVPV
jgi:hypothetical protein